MGVEEDDDSDPYVATPSEADSESAPGAQRKRKTTRQSRSSASSKSKKRGTPGKKTAIIPESEKAISDTGASISAGKVRIPIKPARLSRKRYGHGSREETVITLLGDHVDLQQGMLMRQDWSSEVLGPKVSLLRKAHLGSYGGSLTGTSSSQLDISKQEEVAVADLHLISQYLPSQNTLNVEFIDTELLESRSVSSSTYHTHISRSDQSAGGALTLNTGLINRTLSWLPSHNEQQFLAVGGVPLLAAETRLFSVQSGPGCVQIWRFEKNEREGNSCNLDIVYVHDFGHAWQVAWRPNPQIETPTVSSSGILAAVFGDGTVRVWDVKMEAQTSDKRPFYRRLNIPAFTLRVPDSPCVSLDWLSNTRVAAGCMNGMYVVWDLSLDQTHPISVAHPHATFITHLVSCRRSAPDVLFTSSWDCDGKFTNIWNPEVESLTASRERMYAYAAAWCDMLNCAIINEDQSMVRLISMRGGFSINGGSTTGPVTALATGTHHPFLAIGDAGGLLSITNLIRKTMWKKHAQFRRRVYQLDFSSIDGVYRFSENFAVDEMMGKKQGSKSSSVNTYPKSISINAIAWNCNQGHEGLLASCMQNFVRIDNTIHGE